MVSLSMIRQYFWVVHQQDECQHVNTLIKRAAGMCARKRMALQLQWSQGSCSRINLSIQSCNWTTEASKGSRTQGTAGEMGRRRELYQPPQKGLHIETTRVRRFYPTCMQNTICWQLVTKVALPQIPGKDTLIASFRLGPYTPKYHHTSYHQYLPSETEHLILTGMKAVLEKACYVFTQTWWPYIIEARGLSHVGHLELHWWQTMVMKCKVPRKALDLDQPLLELFSRIPTVRHGAVHGTNKVPVIALRQMLQDAISITKGLRDEERTEELSKWNEVLSQLLPVDQDLTKSQTVAGHHR